MGSDGFLQDGPHSRLTSGASWLSAGRSFAASTVFGTSVSRGKRSAQTGTPMRPPIVLHALPRMHVLLLVQRSAARSDPRRKLLWHEADGVFRGDNEQPEEAKHVAQHAPEEREEVAGRSEQVYPIARAA
jgi:hypothetical protein